MIRLGNTLLIQIIENNFFSIFLKCKPLKLLSVYMQETVPFPMALFTVELILKREGDDVISTTPMMCPRDFF